jgi:hypothetical protein
MSTPGSVVERALRAARGEEALYEEVEADADANIQAATIVAVAVVAAGIGGLVRGGDPLALVFGLVFGLVGWLGYAYACLLVGTRLFPGPQTHADLGQLARVLGFASAPGVLLVLAGIPVLGLAVGAVVWVWQLILTVIALRAALDFTTMRAVGTAVVAMVVMAVVQGIALAVLA